VQEGNLRVQKAITLPLKHCPDARLNGSDPFM